MRKKFKVTLVVFLVVVLGCFSQIFAATNQSNSSKKIAEVRKSIRLFDNATDGGGVVGTVNLNGTANNSAKVGSQLMVPEIGWKRYDDMNSKFLRTGVWNQQSSNRYYCGSIYYTNDSLAKETFKFYGSKLRLILNKYNNKPNNIKIKIDSLPEDTFSEYVSNLGPSMIFGYEKSGLSLGIHTVVISCPNLQLGINWNVDAIDIDSTGYLMDASESLAAGISLNKNTDSLTVEQTDTLTATLTPNDATNKNVTWKSSDTNIATVDSMGRVTAIGAGTATITATTTDGSNLSASCTVTVTGSANPIPSPTDKAVLNITMTNGQIKQYNVTMDTVNKFISWYKLKSAGSCEPFYKFDITETSQPSVIKTDYVIFSKISSFEVDEITGNINQANNSNADILKVVMTNGEAKQYNINMDSISKFISWYDSRQAGSRDPFYEFNISEDSSTNIIKTEYVISDKISSFEVDDYTK